MTRFLSFVFIFIACFCSNELLAQEPIISVQGTLKDANGAAVSDGEQTITFRLYHTESGGAVKYEETTQVSVIGGIYSHNLGSIVPMPDSIFRTNIYLGVEVGGLELTPRTTMTYAPYALSVRAAQRVAQGGCSGQVGDVKYSILPPEAFAEENGDCWVPMNGGSIPAGKALRENHGITSVPDMSGLFIRATEYNDGNDPGRSPNDLYTIQNDENKEHEHMFSGMTNTDGEHSHEHNANGGSRGLAFSNGADTAGGLDFTAGQLNNEFIASLNIMTTGSAHSHNFSGTTDSSGAESRPKNMNFFIYIRID